MQLCTVVHRHFNFSMPTLEHITSSLPEPSRTVMADAQRGLKLMLRRGAPETVGATVLGAYRRLLQQGLHFRSMQAECFYALPQFLMGAAASNKNSIASSVGNELAHLESVLSDIFSGDNTAKHAGQARFNALRRKFAVKRLSTVWRSRLAREQGPPAAMLLLMRRGYTKSRGAIRSRRVYRQIQWSHAMLAQIYRFKMEDDMRQASATGAPTPFATLIYRYHLAKWGCASLAERAIHDLFFNVRNQMNQSKRVQLFAAFLGLHEGAEMACHMACHNRIASLHH
jgi:hypothetical protein